MMAGSSYAGQQTDSNLDFFPQTGSFQATGNMAGSISSVPVQSAPEPPVQDDIFHRSSHPWVLFFTLAFRSLALILYLLGSMLFDNFTLVFVLCILLLASDFWMVKNVSGRLLVGLRWWNRVEDNGTNSWHFESIENLDSVNTSDYRVFWFSLWLYPIIWVALAFISLIKFNFDWLLICVIAVMMMGSNVVGYMKCSKDAKNRIKEYATTTTMNYMMGAFSGGYSRAPQAV